MAEGALQSALKMRQQAREWARPEGYDFATILPYAINRATGQAEWAIPAFLRDSAVGLVDLVTGPQVGDMTPEATMALMDLAGAGMAAPKPRGALGIFGGKSAKTADLDALSMARDMERAGASPSEIWSKTGWGRGADEKWRFEIDDSKARRTEKTERNDLMQRMSDERYAAEEAGDTETYERLTRELWDEFGPGAGVQDGVRAKYFHDHPELFEAYPQLGEMVIRQPDLPDNTLGVYYPGAQGVDIGWNVPWKTGADLHELQHAVQDIEGFARGSSPDEFFPDYGVAAKRLRESIAVKRAQELMDEAGMTAKDAADFVGEANKVDPRNIEFILTERAKSASPPDLDAIIEKQTKNMEEMNPSSMYRRVAGEAEARNVQKRMEWDAARRRAVLPSLTEDVPRDRQIVKGR